MIDYERMIMNSLILIVILTFIGLGLTGCVVVDFERETIKPMNPCEELVLPDANWDCIEFGKCEETDKNE